MLVAAAALAHAAPASAQSWWPSPFSPGARLAMNASGEAVVAWRTSDAVYATTGTAGGFAPATQLATANEPYQPQVGIDDAGNAYVVWETTEVVPAGCKLCDASSYSTGVWLARRRPGATLERPQVLAGRMPVVNRTAYPQLAVRPNGRVAVTWSDADGTVAAVPGAQPRRLAGDRFSASSLGISDAGDLVIGDLQGQLVTCPPSGACAAPRRLSTNGYAGVHVASNGAGKLVAAYPDADGLRVTQRVPGGEWTPSVLLETTNPFKGAAFRGAAVADDGSVNVIWETVGERRRGEYTLLHEAHWSDLAAISMSLVGPYGEDVTRPRLGVSAAGDTAFVWGAYDSSVPLFGVGSARLAVRRRDATAAGPAAVLTPTGWFHAPVDAADVAINQRGDLLAAWADYRDDTAVLRARWLTAAGASPTHTLATAIRPRISFPRVTTISSGRIKPTRRGYVPVVLRCAATTARCSGVLTLTRAGKRSGRARFDIAALRSRRVSVLLTRSTRRLLARRGTLTVTARTTTRDGNASSARLTLRRR